MAEEGTFGAVLEHSNADGPSAVYAVIIALDLLK